MFKQTTLVSTGFLALKIASGGDYITPLPVSIHFHPTEPLTMFFLGLVFIGLARFCRERFDKEIETNPLNTPQPPVKQPHTDTV